MAVQILSKTITRTITRTKRELAEQLLGRALGLLGNSPDKNAGYVVRAIDYFIGDNEKHVITRNWIHNWLAEGRPGREWLSRILLNTHPNVRRCYVARMVVSMFFRDPEVNERCRQEWHTPIWQFWAWLVYHLNV